VCIFARIGWDIIIWWPIPEWCENPVFFIATLFQCREYSWSETLAPLMAVGPTHTTNGGMGLGPFQSRAAPGVDILTVDEEMCGDLGDQPPGVRPRAQHRSRNPIGGGGLGPIDDCKYLNGLIGAPDPGRQPNAQIRLAASAELLLVTTLI